MLQMFELWQFNRVFIRMKIYTKKGDRGETAIFYGLNINKHSLRVECLGTVDELNASIGAANTLIQQQDISTLLKQVQHTLFNIGAELAKLSIHQEISVALLEQAIDYYQQQLPALKNFILPSGCQAATALHMARTICRRAERKISKLYQAEEVSENTLAYLNRLSDLLFVLARTMNHRAGIQDELWRR